MKSSLKFLNSEPGTTIKTAKKCPIKSWANGRTGSVFLVFVLGIPSPFFPISVFYVLRKNEAESNFRLLWRLQKIKIFKSSDARKSLWLTTLGVKIGSFCLLTFLICIFRPTVFARDLKTTARIINGLSIENSLVRPRGLMTEIENCFPSWKWSCC